jgi:PPOX class probable F420-dependent enzyme
MDDRVRTFLERNHAAAMVTLREDGTPHVARVGVGLVDGALLSSGTRGRLRTRHLRRDPRSTLMVFEGWSWLGLETVVTIHDGPDAPERNLALYRAIAGEPDDVDEYLEAMVREERLVYEFDIGRAYGSY